MNELVYHNMQMHKNITLICKSVWFYSSGDETSFFDWIKRIPSINSYNGKLDELYLYIENKIIADSDLRELIALFKRYRIKMQQLAIFLTEDNRHWFLDYKEIFK